MSVTCGKMHGSGGLEKGTKKKRLGGWVGAHEIWGSDGFIHFPFLLVFLKPRLASNSQ